MTSDNRGWHLILPFACLRKPLKSRLLFLFFFPFSCASLCFYGLSAMYIYCVIFVYVTLNWHISPCLVVVPTLPYLAFTVLEQTCIRLYSAGIALWHCPLQPSWFETMHTIVLFFSLIFKTFSLIRFHSMRFAVLLFLRWWLFFVFVLFFYWDTMSDFTYWTILYHFLDFNYHFGFYYCYFRTHACTSCVFAWSRVFS